MAPRAHTATYYDRANSHDGFSSHDIDTQKLWDQFIEDFQEHAVDYECTKSSAYDNACEFSPNVISKDDHYPEGIQATCTNHRGTAFINNPNCPI